MNIIYQSGTDFFLTGGTALSRAYYNHRYSDDLDFFVNHSTTYDEQVNLILLMLRDNGYTWDTDKEFIRAKNFTTLKVRKDTQTVLKLDFVNDLVPHFGGIAKTKLFYRTDSIRNILSNKLSAIFRYAAKDIVDIREIALNETINWATIIQEARQKEAGIELTYVSEIMCSIPQNEYESVAWVNKPDWTIFQEDIKRIVYGMIKG